MLLNLYIFVRIASFNCLLSGFMTALTDNGKFLLAAKRRRHPTYTDYIISLNSNDMSSNSSACVGKLRYAWTLLQATGISVMLQSLNVIYIYILRSNFFGTKFTIFDGKPPHAGAKATKNSTMLVKTKQVLPRVRASIYPVAQIKYKTNLFGSR